ncbi:hypothetical protein R1A27_20335 [Methylobacterium sp. NMS12]
MTVILALPPVCSAAVVVLSLLGVRPIIVACTLPAVIGCCWGLA